MEAKRPWFFRVCGLILLSCGVAAGQERTSVPADSLNQLFTRALPHLEGALGTRLDPPPQIKTVSPELLLQAPDSFLEPQMRRQFPELQGEALTTALRLAGTSLNMATAVRYHEGTSDILVAPDNLARMAAWDESLARVHSPEVLQLLLVRETARLVLDRRYHLAALRAGCRDAESFQILQAVVEGRVMQVTQQVAGRLGLDSYFPLLAECYLYAPEVGADPAVRAACQEMLRRRQWAAVQGLAFFNALQARGLKDAEKQVFAAPPRQLTGIARPDLYLKARQANRPDLRALLARLESALPPGEWKGMQQPWTPAEDQPAAELLGEGDRAEKVLAAWDEGGSLVWVSRSNPTHQVALSLARFADAAAARAYFGFAVDLQRKSDGLMASACTSGQRVVESRTTDVSLRGTDQAVRNDRQLQFGTTAPPVPVGRLLARAGDLVIVVAWQSVPADVAWAERVVGACLPGPRP